MSYTSQWKQDEILNEKFFKNKRNGVFVDVGAHDGKTGSNTYFFEKDLGWSGLCIEPILDRYVELVKNRPKSICIFGCIYETSGTVDFREINGYSEMLSGIEKCYDSRHIQRIKDELAQQGGTYKITQKHSFCLKDLFNLHNLTNIDYLSIDTEGSEMEVIKGIDFTKVNIHVIDIENNYSDDRVKIYLENKGYSLTCKIGGDDIYVKNDDKQFSIEKVLTKFSGYKTVRTLIEVGIPSKPVAHDVNDQFDVLHVIEKDCTRLQQAREEGRRKKFYNIIYHFGNIFEELNSVPSLFLVHEDSANINTFAENSIFVLEQGNQSFLEKFGNRVKHSYNLGGKLILYF